MEATPFRDSELSAWLDGAYDATSETAARIDAWLAQNPEAAARVAAWSADRDALRQYFGPIAAEPVPDALQRVVWRRERAPRWAQAAAAVALLMIGGVVGALVGATSRSAAPVAEGWVDRALQAHQVYVPEPRHAVEVKAQEEHLSRWLSARTELPIQLFDLRGQGFELVGGRLLPDGRGKSAQLMYQDAQGVRVTVYLRKPEAPADVELAWRPQGDVGLFYWVEDGVACAIVGALPRERLHALAETIYPHKAEGPGPAASGATRS
jgi:anti-sigma factor RsiW